MSALYADDTKLYRKISSPTDVENLQQAVDNLHSWSIHNNISFKASKCEVLTITRKKNPLIYDYHLGNIILKRVTEEKDLGVMVTSKLTWDSHVHMVTTKVNRLLGLLRRTCPMMTDVNARRTLYLALVKSQMSFATQVYGLPVNQI